MTARDRILRAGFRPERIAWAARMCEDAVQEHRVPGCALSISRGGGRGLTFAWGESRSGVPASGETRWLIASLTKPVVCAAVCTLVERGRLGLDDPVRRHLPEFSGEDRRATTIRHLLTHTSGLPDMLPENVELRKAHAPLADFVRRTCTTPLSFPPGTRVQYQSMGIALLGAIVERLTGASCAEYMRQAIFRPLKMKDSSLGRSPTPDPRVAWYRPSEGQPASDWDWNSPYWQAFGAPWGGMYSTVGDYRRFLIGVAGGGRGFLSREMASEMRSTQTTLLPDLPESEKRRSSWGLGLRTAYARESEYLGDLVSSETFGHAGSTGTGAWHDPVSEVTFVYMSNQPQSGRHIGLLSNIIAGAAI